MAVQVAPGRRPSRSSRLVPPLSTAALAVAGVVALHVRDPHEHGSWGLCPFKALTGWNCPGCGGLRAVNDLTRGDLGAAAHSNLLLVLLVPVAVLAWSVWVRKAWVDDLGAPRSRRVQLLGYALIASGLLFAVVRNTPWGQSFAVS